MVKGGHVTKKDFREMNLSFEPMFKTHQTRTAQGKDIIVNKNGDILVSKDLCDSLRLQKSRYLWFGYDAANKVVGVRVMANIGPDSYQVNMSKNGSGHCTCLRLARKLAVPGLFDMFANGRLVVQLSTHRDKRTFIGIPEVLSEKKA
jgi:hypothetical protein